MDDSRELYRQKYEAQLKEWGAKLDVVHASVEKATAQAKIDLAPHLEAARTKFEVAKARLSEVSHVADDKWEALKLSADHAWHEVKAAVEGALEALKNKPTP